MTPQKLKNREHAALLFAHDIPIFACTTRSVYSVTTFDINSNDFVLTSLVDNIPYSATHNEDMTFYNSKTLAATEFYTKYSNGRGHYEKLLATLDFIETTLPEIVI